MDLNSSSSTFNFQILDKLFALSEVSNCSALEIKLYSLAYAWDIKGAPQKYTIFSPTTNKMVLLWGWGYFFLLFPAI